MEQADAPRRAQMRFELPPELADRTLRALRDSGFFETASKIIVGQAGEVISVQNRAAAAKGAELIAERFANGSASSAALALAQAATVASASAVMMSIEESLRASNSESYSAMLKSLAGARTVWEQMDVPSLGSETVKRAFADLAHAVSHETVRDVALTLARPELAGVLTAAAATLSAGLSATNVEGASQNGGADSDLDLTPTFIERETARLQEPEEQTYAHSLADGLRALVKLAQASGWKGKLSPETFQKVSKGSQAGALLAVAQTFMENPDLPITVYSLLSMFLVVFGAGDVAERTLRPFAQEDDYAP